MRRTYRYRYDDDPRPKKLFRWALVFLLLAIVCGFLGVALEPGPPMALARVGFVVLVFVFLTTLATRFIIARMD